MPRPIDLDVEPEILLGDSGEDLAFFDDEDRRIEEIVRQAERLGLRSVAIGGRPRNPDPYLNEEEA